MFPLILDLLQKKIYSDISDINNHLIGFVFKTCPQFSTIVRSTSNLEW